MVNWIVVYLALINFFGIYLFPRDRVPSQKWFSFSSGIAITYFFLYLLPSLNQRQDTLRIDWLNLSLPSEIYFVSLIGFTLFYGTMRFIRLSFFQDTRTEKYFSYYLQIGLLTGYMFFSAYVVTASFDSVVTKLFYATALGIHFLAVGNDLYLRYGDKFIKRGRYFITVGILCGGIFSYYVDLMSHVETIIFAFVAGAMILNIVKYKLPTDRELVYPVFIATVIIYSFILIILKHAINL